MKSVSVKMSLPWYYNRIQREFLVIQVNFTGNVIFDCISLFIIENIQSSCFHQVSQSTVILSINIFTTTYLNTKSKWENSQLIVDLLFPGTQ